MGWKTIPNFVTMFGILVTFTYTWLFLSNNNNNLILPTLILASLTDVADGFLARLLNQKSKIGIFLDPIRDKLLLTAILINITLIYGSEIIYFIISIALLEISGGIINFIKGLPQPVHPIGKIRGFIHFFGSSIIISSNYITWPFQNSENTKWIIYCMLFASFSATIAYAFFNKSKK